MSARVLLLGVAARQGDRIRTVLEQRQLTVEAVADLRGSPEALHDIDIVIVGGRDVGAVAASCRLVREAGASRSPVLLAVAPKGDVKERVALLEAGADDVLGAELDERELDALVEILLMRTSAARGDTPVSEHHPRGKPGRVVCFASAKGGSGTTTLAVNAAIVLSQMAPTSVAIADFDMHHGQVGTLLNLESPVSTAALAREAGSGDLSELLDEAARTYAGGLTVLTGPLRPDEATNVSADQLAAVTHELSLRFGTLIVDLGSTLDMRALNLAERADQLALIVTPDISSLRLLHQVLQVIAEGGTAAERAVFVINNVQPPTSIGAEQIEEHLGIKVEVSVPHDARSFVRAANEGRPVVLIAHRAPAAVAIDRLASTVSGSPVAAVEEPLPRRGLLGGFRGRDRGAE